MAALRCVDLFAGLGGFSAGAEAAGARVVLAANHNALCVATHARNHPRTRHECADLREYDWATLPAFDLLLASPCCQGNSQAAQPARARSTSVRRHHDALRATAWAVVDCVEVCRPRGFIVENTPGFMRWNKFPLWCEALKIDGYSLAVHRLIATDYGVPQRRDRLFVVGVLGNRAPRLELPTARREPGFGPSVQWKAGDWKPISSAPRECRARMVGAVKRWGSRCIVQDVTGHKGLPLTDPVRTITTCDQWKVIKAGRLYRNFTLRETARAMGFADSFGWAEDAGRRNTVRMLGNAVCPPVARRLVAEMGAIL